MLYSLFQPPDFIRNLELKFSSRHRPCQDTLLTKGNLNLFLGGGFFIFIFLFSSSLSPSFFLFG